MACSQVRVRWLIGLVVLAHGIGHLLFMPPLFSVMAIPVNGRSWLLTPTLGEGLTSLLSTVVAAGALLGFVAVGIGIIRQTPWWRRLAVGAGVLSLVLIVAMWDGLPTSSAFFGLAFDLVVLAALWLGGRQSRAPVAR